MRHTRSHTANRRSHHALKEPAVAVCKNCGGSYRPHHMCLNCGFYNGRIVIDLLAKKKARDERLAAKKAVIRGDEKEKASALAEAPALAAAPKK